MAMTMNKVVVSSSPIVVNRKMEALIFSETSVPRRATRCNVLEDGIHRSLSISQNPTTGTYPETDLVNFSILPFPLKECMHSSSTVVLQIATYFDTHCGRQQER
jgi:hypothetical protein